jgi:hypothetical protein
VNRPHRTRFGVRLPWRWIEPLESRRYFAAITFANHVDFAAGTAPTTIVAKDLNGDGRIDLAVADSTAKDVEIFLGNGDGTFSAGPVLPVTAAPVSLVTGDFNGDGHTDLAVGGSPGTLNAGTTVTVFLNNGNGTFGLGQSTTVAITGGANEPIALAAADFNGDGKADLAATDFTGGNAVVLLSIGNGMFQTPVTYSVGTNPTAITSLDFNSDGHPDLAVTSTGADPNTAAPIDQVMLLLGSSAGTFSSGGGVQLTTGGSAGGSQSIITADVNGDSKPDLIVGNTDATASVLINSGSAFSLGNPVALSSPSTGIVAADFNLDGDLDFASADGASGINTSTNSATVAQGAGDGTFSTTAQFATGAQPTGIAAADFNGDGKPDLATVNPVAGTVSILLNNTIIALKKTKTKVAADTDPAPFGQSVTFTATVTGPAGSPNPTGTVQFFDGSTLLGSATLAMGSNQAAFMTASLGVGNHMIHAVYQGDGTFAASTAASFVQTITPTADNGPDLVGMFVSTTLPSLFVTGEKATVKIRMTNQGNFAAKGVITNLLSLSLDNLPDGSDINVPIKGRLSKTRVNLQPGASMVLTGSLKIPGNVPESGYVLLASLNTTGTLLESNTANNAVPSPITYSAVNEFGTVAGRRAVVLTLPDANGTPVTYRLNGPGVGTVTTGDDGIDVSLADTTTGSSLLITAKSEPAELHSLSSSEPVATIKASSVDFNGNVQLTGGANRILLHDLNHVALTSSAGIQSISAGNWSGNISAPWIGNLVSQGDFDADLSLNGAGAPGGVTLRSIRVGGKVNSSTWNINGDLNRANLQGISNAAWSGNISGQIRSFSDAGNFTGNLAAGTFGSILIRGNVDHANLLAGANFGPDGQLGGGDDTFASGSIRSLRVLGNVTSSLFAAALNPVAPDDLLNPAGTLLPDGSIQSIFVGGAADTASKFLAASLPSKVKIDGAAVDPASDPRFQI